MGIRITNVGPLCSVQDGGRYGYAEYGFSVSGAMDLFSHRIANILVGNDRDQAAIEMTLFGLSGEFTSDAVIAITGADVSPEINGVSIPSFQAVKVKKGDMLECSFAKNGCRAYLAVNSGFYLKKVMGSLSTNLKCKIGGYMGRALKSGDLLYFNTVAPSVKRMSKRVAGLSLKIENPARLGVLLGPQDDYFTEKGIDTFFSAVYALTNESDRMGVKLDGAAVESKGGVDIISDGIPLGAVQIPASGKPIVMTADRQTVGGYAKIGTVISTDVSVLGQLRPGDSLSFYKTTPDRAKEAYMESLNILDGLDRRLNHGVFYRLKRTRL